MKLNVLGVLSAVSAFISLALPWWEFSGSYPGGRFFTLVYLWGFLADGRFMHHAVGVEWYGSIALMPYIALSLIVIGGVLGVIASITTTKKEKTLLGLVGILLMLSAVVFAGGQYTMSRMSIDQIGPEWSIFEYPSFGFWLALIAAVIIFVAYIKCPKVI